MSGEKVNINQADAAELAALPGIGEKLAAKIIEYREVHPFMAIADLAFVSGISEQMVSEITEFLTVGEIAESRETFEPGSEVVESDAEGSPYPEGEATTEREAGDIVEAAPEMILPPESEGESTEHEEISAPTEGDLPLEEEAAAQSGIGPEMEGMASSPSELENELGSGPESESIVILESDVEEADLEEEPGAEKTAPSEEDTQPVLIAGYILSTLAGAFLGAVLVLFFLLVVNRTLRFAGDTRANDLQQQFDQEITTLSQREADLSAEANTLAIQIEELNSQLATVTAAQGALTESQGDMRSDLLAIDEEMQTLNGTLSDLNDNVITLDERLSKIDESAEDFDAFLNGMRELLLTLQEPGPSVTATATITATAPSPGVISPSPSAATLPTRTPRPTATPLSLPTPTRAP